MKPGRLAILLRLGSALIGAFPGGTRALAQTTPAITITGAWARATAPRQDAGAVYMTLIAPTGDRLLAAACPDADMAMLHQNARQSGVSSMRDVDSVVLPPGKAVPLAPRGTHIMLMGLKHGLVAGGALALTLTFEKAGEMRQTVPVLPIGAQGP